MAREEEDREDLLSEATALTTRAEFQIPGYAEPIVMGFRSNRAASLFVGPKWVWHFDPAGQVRRGYDDGKLIKADRHQLVAMRRMRYADRVELVHTSEHPEQQDRWLTRLAADLANIRQAWQTGDVHCTGAVPNAISFQQELIQWLDQLPLPLRIAPSLVRRTSE